MAYYRRHAWGARPTRGGTKLDRSQVKGIALHWPGDTVKRGDVDTVKAALRGFQTHHMDTSGWSDIAYQEAVDQAGNVYRLRGLKVRSAANGDGTTNLEYGAVLLVLAIGETPSEAMILAVKRIVLRHRRIFRYSRQVVPHSAIRPEPTDCPGDKVRAFITAGRFDPDDY